SCVDYIHAANQVVFIIKSLDEMAKTFGCVGREVIDILKLRFSTETIHQFDVIDAALHEASAFTNVVGKAATQIVKHSHFMMAMNQFLSDMRSDKACTTRY